MSIFDSISRSIKNVFVGSHKGDDFKYDPPEGEYLPEVDWFENPLDSMPIANGSNKYAPPEKMLELDTNPRPEEEIADWFTDKPDESDEIEKEKTIHEKLYSIATDKYNPFSVGGSEQLRKPEEFGPGGPLQNQAGDGRI
tara:strand:+ start:1087 stop:1506 length:420 start_codon:yes stop_codon:yes gene_type:complete